LRKDHELHVKFCDEQKKKEEEIEKVKEWKGFCSLYPNCITAVPRAIRRPKFHSGGNNIEAQFGT
jgi:hypothetical protein